MELFCQAEHSIFCPKSGSSAYSREGLQQRRNQVQRKDSRGRNWFFCPHPPFLGTLKALYSLRGDYDLGFILPNTSLNVFQFQNYVADSFSQKAKGEGGAFPSSAQSSGPVSLSGALEQGSGGSPCSPLRAVFSSCWVSASKHWILYSSLPGSPMTIQPQQLFTGMGLRTAPGLGERRMERS